MTLMLPATLRRLVNAAQKQGGRVRSDPVSGR
jgi:hypothetical protein